MLAMTIRCARNGNRLRLPTAGRLAVAANQSVVNVIASPPDRTEREVRRSNLIMFSNYYCEDCFLVVKFYFQGLFGNTTKIVSN